MMKDRGLLAKPTHDTIIRLVGEAGLRFRH